MTAPNLTDRELDVISCFGGGLSYRQVSEELGIALTTVGTHMQRIKHKYADAGRPITDDKILTGILNRALEDGHITQLPTHRPID